MQKIAAIALMAALCLCASTALQLEFYPPLPEEAYLVRALVEKVVDGDTIWAQMEVDGVPVSKKIRFLIADTPETVHPTRAEEPGGIEASDYTTMMLEGKEVWLEYDKGRTDVHGRQLCHVWLDDGTLFTLHLVEQGYAQMKIYPPNIRYEKFFILAQHSMLKPIIWASGKKRCASMRRSASSPAPPSMWKRKTD